MFKVSVSIVNFEHALAGWVRKKLDENFFTKFTKYFPRIASMCSFAKLITGRYFSILARYSQIKTLRSCVDVVKIENLGNICKHDYRSDLDNDL